MGGRGLVGTLAVLLGLAACGAEPRPPNVLIISIDTLRADRLGVYGNHDWGDTPSPVIDALASEGVVFEQCYAPRGATHPSLASMLTGKYPITTGLRENSFPLGLEHLTILERLQAEGWQTGAFIANFEVTHKDDAWVARGADVAADGFGGRRRKEASKEAHFQQLWDDRVEQAALEFLAGVDPERPFALWVHFYDVHKPFNPPEGSFDLYGDVDAMPRHLTELDDAFGADLERHLFEITINGRPYDARELQRLRGLYDATVTATDARVGRLREALVGMGVLDRTHVLVTSDHGEELGDHNDYFFHGCSIYEGVVRIPLVWRGPDVVPRRVPAQVQNIDILPTLLELLALPPDEEIEGVSMAPLLDGSSSEPVAPFAFIEWQDLVYAVTDGRYKLIYNPEHVHPRHSPWAYDGVPDGFGFRIDCLEGYDLGADPVEQVNLLADVTLREVQRGQGLPPEFQRLFDALLDWLADPDHQQPMYRGGLSATQMQRMRALGYLGTGTREDSVRMGSCRVR